MVSKAAREKQANALSAILMDTARDLARAHVAGKPLSSIEAEGAARIAANYQSRICSTPDCGHLTGNPHLERCNSCDRELRGPFSFGEDE